ncbi:NAD(+) diphosphatase [Microbacterium dauci]|uniref:NAD(+) diphosphatase n=1 Tax=Microbacterium dauci TaxID=3048008 RepID=A0ABT6ZCP5_9MICO|nr:NAD(+) diphosphatase [Microbacterium sp. LX3-4]MDJ1113505.1 NAD(+) diphosphatase [Microbacterium sp. LX3-4]
MTTKDVPPPLARAVLDRADGERLDAALLDRVRADASTRALRVHGDRAPVANGLLQWGSVLDVTEPVEWAFLGRAEDGSALLAAIADPDAAPQPDLPWQSLRAVGGDLAPDDAGRFVQAVALGRWLWEAPFCPRCGARTEVGSSGWSRTCPSCGRQHFPRTDPAVIVSVASADGERLLLGRNAAWGDVPVFSTFAGFVEAGESLESTVHREVAEESGVRVERVEYRGSQAWPYPRSLMLGFHAHAIDDAEARPDGDEIVEVRWFSRTEIVALLAGDGDVRLPGPASIARSLIQSWARG